jgi:hypothetical protein
MRIFFRLAGPSVTTQLAGSSATCAPGNIMQCDKKPAGFSFETAAIY